MKKMTQEEFDEICEKHQKWLKTDDDVEQALFENVNLEDINLDHLDLKRTKFSKVVFKESIMDANLRLATFRDCTFQNVVFSYCDMSIAIFKGCSFQNCEFSYTNLRIASFENTNLNGSKFYACCLDSNHFENINLNGSKFSNCCLDGTYFDSHSDTCGIEFHNCNLTRIDMLEPVYSIGPIGSRYCLTTFFAGRNIVQCGCWNKGKGGTLEEFKARINEIYPPCSEEEEVMFQEDLMFREQYLAAIEFFERMRKLYLAEKERV